MARRAYFVKKGRACRKGYKSKHVGRGKKRRKLCIPPKKKGRRRGRRK